MKLLILTLLSFSLQAKTIYVSSTQVVKTINEVNVLSLASGDSVLFNGAENFIGQLNTKEGVYYGSYNGVSKLTGFVSITKWVNLGGGIYEAPCNAVNMVLVSGKQQPMGRFPNGKDSWIYATSVSGSMPVTVTFDTPIPDFSGAHIVQRKQHWIVDHNLIKSNSSNSLVYTELPGSTTRQPFVKGFGFFIENHPSTLDQIGEWYYNPSTKKLRVFMGSKILPVKVATVQYIVNAAKGSKIENLTLEGSNDHIVNVTGDNLTINKCIIQYAGRSGVSVNFNVWHRLSITNNTIRYINDMGIYTDWRGGDYVTITGNTIYDIGLIPGTGGWGDLGQSAINTSGSYGNISNNTIRRIGYSGIRFGDKINSTVSRNLIDSFCLTKDDGSGIYAYRGSSTNPASGNKVLNNIIINAIGNPHGTPQAAELRKDAFGIYMDENASGVLIDGNTVWNARYGMFNNRPNNITYTNNTFGNCEVPMTTWMSASNYPIKGMTFTGNVYVARLDKWRPLVQWWETTGQNTIPSWGVSDYNFYVSGWTNTFIGSAPTFNEWTNHTLAQWQTSSKYGTQDIHSKFLQTNVPHRIEYNATTKNKTIELLRVYADAKGNIYSGSVTLKPFTSIILIELDYGKLTSLSTEIRRPVHLR